MGVDMGSGRRGYHGTKNQCRFSLVFIIITRASGLDFFNRRFPTLSYTRIIFLVALQFLMYAINHRFYSLTSLVEVLHSIRLGSEVG
jgi:hypothetical protein